MVTQDGSAVPFNSLTRVGTAGGFKGLYKLFSKGPIPQAWLSMLFEGGYEIPVTHEWKAYPAFDPPENFPPFQLADGLYYNSAAENAASALEIAAIEGRNVALLVAKQFSNSYNVDKNNEGGILEQGSTTQSKVADQIAAAAA